MVDGPAPLEQRTIRVRVLRVCPFTQRPLHPCGLQEEVFARLQEKQRELERTRRAISELQAAEGEQVDIASAPKSVPPPAPPPTPADPLAPLTAAVTLRSTPCLHAASPQRANKPPHAVHLLLWPYARWEESTTGECDGATELGQERMAVEELHQTTSERESHV